MEEIIDRLKKVRRGAMFIIEAPSGTGKSAVVKEILRRDPNIKFSVSVTTRQPREGEVDGVDYYFITDKQYDEFLAQDAFYEYVDSQYGSRYGTLRSEVDSFINVGEDVLFDMDWASRRAPSSISSYHPIRATRSAWRSSGISPNPGQASTLGRTRLPSSTTTTTRGTSRTRMSW